MCPSEKGAEVFGINLKEKMVPKKLTIEEARARILVAHGDEVVLDENTYARTNKKAKFVDKLYGEWWALPKDVFKGHGHSARAVVKRKNTTIERYGVENAMQSEAIKGKVRKTNLERYGVEYPLLNEEILNKAKMTCVIKYGAENAMQSETIRAKARETNLERYGVEFPIQSKAVMEKVNKTNIERYGAMNVFQNDAIKEKSKKTNLEKLGTEYPMQNERVRKKSRETNMKRYGFGCSFQNVGVRERFKQSCLEKYGVAHPMQNHEVALKNAKAQNNSFTTTHWKTGEEVVCQASYEKKVVEYLNENKIEYKWQHKTFTMPNGRTYRPDLYLIGKRKPWIEIKGYFRKDAREKWDWFHEQVKPNS